MFKNPSIIMRITYGKTIGLIFAGGGILLFPHVFPDIGWITKLAFVLYYIMIGAFVGLMGVLNYHPLIKMPLPWWFRGPWIGGWMNLILMMFIYDDLSIMQTQFFGAGAILASPWWFVVEGALFGLFTDYICTRYAGEGVACVTNAELENSVE